MNFFGDPDWPAPTPTPGWEERLEKASIALGEAAADQLDKWVLAVILPKPAKNRPDPA